MNKENTLARVFSSPNQSSSTMLQADTGINTASAIRYHATGATRRREATGLARTVSCFPS